MLTCNLQQVLIKIDGDGLARGSWGAQQQKIGHTCKWVLTHLLSSKLSALYTKIPKNDWPLGKEKADDGGLRPGRRRSWTATVGIRLCGRNRQFVTDVRDACRPPSIPLARARGWQPAEKQAAGTKSPKLSVQRSCLLFFSLLFSPSIAICSD